MKRLRMTTLTVLASAMVLLTSCLGEGGSETSLYGIAGVVESQPLTYKKVVRISDGSLIYSPGLDADASIEPGDCCLIDMYIDYSVQNVEQLGYYAATISNYVDVDKWFISSSTDSLKVRPNEQMIYDIPSLNFISNKLFIYSQHKEQSTQKNTYRLTYNPNEEVKEVDGYRIYNFYFSCQKVEDGKSPEITPYHVNAFDVEYVLKQIAQKEKTLGNDKLSFKINYIKTINADSSFVKGATQRITWDVSSILGTSN